MHACSMASGVADRTFGLQLYLLLYSKATWAVIICSGPKAGLNPVKVWSDGVVIIEAQSSNQCRKEQVHEHVLLSTETSLALQSMVRLAWSIAVSSPMSMWSSLSPLQLLHVPVVLVNVWQGIYHVSLQIHTWLKSIIRSRNWMSVEIGENSGFLSSCTEI